MPGRLVHVESSMIRDGEQASRHSGQQIPNLTPGARPARRSPSTAGVPCRRARRVSSGSFSGTPGGGSPAPSGRAAQSAGLGGRGERAPYCAPDERGGTSWPVWGRRRSSEGACVPGAGTHGDGQFQVGVGVGVDETESLGPLEDGSDAAAAHGRRRSCAGHRGVGRRSRLPQPTMPAHRSECGTDRRG